MPIEDRLKELPDQPGVYFHKDSTGDIIYIGKAANLRNRVRQYFHKNRYKDPKTDALIAEIDDIDWMVVDSEIEALFLEAEMVRRYMPKYNILLRDDKSLIYIRISYDSDFPTVTTTRRPLDDGAKYFGPYLSAGSVRQALKMLRKVFPYATRRVPGQKRATLHFHLGLDPGLEEGKTSLKEYRASLRKLIAVIEGRRKAIEREIEAEMQQYAKENDFEKAAEARNQLFALKRLSQQIVFSDKEFQDIQKDHALAELVELLGLDKYPRRIEGFDVSHMSGSDVVASMVVFTNGATNKSEYRKFKTRLNKNDDFYNMHETLSRRFKDKIIQKWGIPDFIIIDGGKGQLDAALRARNSADSDEIRKVPMAGLAKREEQIVVKKAAGVVAGKTFINRPLIQKLGGYLTETDGFFIIELPKSTNLVKLLQRIRDESHRFAVSYHSVVKSRRQTSSKLDDVPGIGPATKKKLLKKFGSVKAVKETPPEELREVIGQSKAAAIRAHLK